MPPFKLNKFIYAGAVAFGGLTCYELYTHREFASKDRPIFRRLRPQKAIPDDRESFPIRLARYLTFKAVSGVEILGLEVLNHTKVYHKEKLQQYFDRPSNQGLITVSNHQTTLDDPGLLCPLVRPIHFSKLQNVRWGTCSEEYCYKNSFFASFFTAGKTLPVKRGGGINHISFLDILEKVKAGQWVHIFPEGRTWQENNYPPRDENGCRVSAHGRKSPPGRYLGPLKWGVGKLIADSDVTPIVVPFYHRGMEEIYPLDEQNNNKYALPKFGKNVYLLVGDAIPVKDIVDEYKSVIDNEPDEDRKEVLRYAMYKALTDRIDQSLARLEVELLEIQKSDSKNNTGDSMNTLTKSIENDPTNKNKPLLVDLSINTDVSTSSETSNTKTSGSSESKL